MSSAAHRKCNCPVPYPIAKARALGHLGVSAGDAAKGVGVSVASKAAGGAAGSAAVSSGLVAAGGLAAGALTLGVGLVVAFALGKLLKKNYINVPAMNAKEDQDVAAYNQYLTVMGQAPGRAFGLDAMLAVWRGANHSGLFALNNGVQCFHEGCSKYPGRGDWINEYVANYGVHGNINFPDAWYRFSQDRNAADFGPLAYNPHPTPSGAAAPQSYAAAQQPPAVPPGAVPQALAPLAVTTPVNAPAMIAARTAAMRSTLRGLGQTASPQGDAVNFVDNFLLPYNAAHGTWVVPKGATEQQILYDVADAFLASKGITTTPYIATPTVAAPPVTPVAPVAVPPGIANTMQPNYSPTPVPPSAQPVFPPQPTSAFPVQYAVPPPESQIPNFGTVSPLLDPTTGALVNPTAPAQPVTAGLSNIPPWLMAAAGAALLVSFALARPMPGGKSKRRRPR